MTGFGRGECIRYDRKAKVELKSVNHRFSDFTIKLPRFLNPLEDRIRKRLSQDITRGKVDVWISFESYTQKDITINVNESFADTYMDALRILSKRYSLGEPEMRPALELLAKNPDVVTFDKFESALSSKEVQDEIWELLSEAMENALKQFNGMRDAEGDAMSKDIESKHQEIRSIVGQMRERAPLIVNDHASKLRNRLSDLMNKIRNSPDESRLLTEIAILADKSDVDEELARLISHLDQLESMLKEDGAIGRKMDFLVQELNREANTVSSKSSDVNMTKLAVDLKSLIEKVREQVQNIE